MTLAYITKINIVRERKKRPLRFYNMLYKTILAFKNRWVKCFLRDTLFGNLRSWKRSQGQTPKNYFLNFLAANLESLLNFL